MENTMNTLMNYKESNNHHIPLLVPAFQLNFLPELNNLI